jgi:hypothetical protein
MTVRVRTAACLAGLAFLAGCKAFDRDGRGTGTGRVKDGGTGNRHGSDVASGDPLLGGKYIPKQDIPIPGRDEAIEKRDPLLRASNDRREPFRLGPENTTAALAGKPQDDVPRLDDRRMPNEAGRGPVPFKAPDGTRADAPTASLPTLDTQLDTLRSWGARFGEPQRDSNGEYSFACELPGGDGPVKRYEGVGRSPTAAVFQVVDQIRTDRGR